LPIGSSFCTRRPQICKNCGENSLKHTILSEMKLALCKNPYKFSKGNIWQPLPPKLKVGCEKCGDTIFNHYDGLHCSASGSKTYLPKKYAICSGRGTKAICECGYSEKKHGGMPLSDLKTTADANFLASLHCGHSYTPLSCELLSVMDKEEWAAKDYTAESKLGQYARESKELLNEEAHSEGFNTWAELDKWIVDYYGARPKMWRYVFRR